MPTRMLSRARPKPTNISSLPESSDSIVASVIHSISPPNQPTSPDVDLPKNHELSPATLSDLVSQRIRIDNAKDMPREKIPKIFQTLSAMSPITPKQPVQTDSLEVPEISVNTSIARAIGSLPPWHQNYRADPTKLIAHPYDKVYRPPDKITQELNILTHSQISDTGQLEQQRPKTAQYLPIAMTKNETNSFYISANRAPNNNDQQLLSPSDPSVQTLSPRRITQTTHLISPFDPHDGMLHNHSIMTHLKRESSGEYNELNASIASITRTVLANRVPAPAIMQPSFFDRPQVASIPGKSNFIPVTATSEPLGTTPLHPDQQVPYAIQTSTLPNNDTVEQFVEIISKQPPPLKPKDQEPLSVMIQKAILRQHKEQLKAAPDKFAEVVARIQPMKGIYDIDTKGSQPSNVLTQLENKTSPLREQTKHGSPVPSSNSDKTEITVMDKDILLPQQSDTKGDRSGKRHSQKMQRSSSTESSSSYYYSSYSEDSDNKLEWISLGKNLSDYPLYITKYAQCGKCQHKHEAPIDKPFTLPNEEIKGQIGINSSPHNMLSNHQSPSIYTCESHQLRNSKKHVPIKTETADNPDSEVGNVPQITRLKVVQSVKQPQKESDSIAKEIVVLAGKRIPPMETISPGPSNTGEFTQMASQSEPSIELSQHLNGFQRQTVEDVDYSTVLFVLSKEPSTTSPSAIKPISTPNRVKRDLPPRSFKQPNTSMQSPPSISVPALTQLQNRNDNFVKGQFSQASNVATPDSCDEVRTILMYPFHSVSSPVEPKQPLKLPSDPSYLSTLGTILQNHTVSAISETPERFQHYPSDTSILDSLRINHGNTPNTPLYQPITQNIYSISSNIAGTTPNLQPESFSSFEEGELAQGSLYGYDNFSIPLSTYASIEPIQQPICGSLPLFNSEEVPSLVELANCSLTPEEDLVLAKALEALNI